MAFVIRNILALLIAAAILLGSNGLQTTLLAVRADIEGFSLTAIGLLTSAYFVGFIAGCRYAPRFVQRAGHIRAFTAFASIASAVALLYLLALSPATWLVMRVVTGFCFAGLHMIMESWLNEKATNENRGKVLSIYRIADFSAVTAGQFFLNVADPAGFVLFAFVSIFISLSLVPVALTKAEAPRPLRSAKLDLPKIWRVSPLAAASVFAVGAAGGAYWAVAPVLVRELGYGLPVVSGFLSAVIFGGAIAQWPSGWLSDRIDRRQVIVGAAACASVASLLLLFFGAASATTLIILGYLLGSFHLPLFGLGIAHANDHAEAEEFVSVNSGLLLIYGLGAVLGPLIAPVVMELTTVSGLWGYVAVVYAGLVAFGLYRMTQREAVPVDEQEDYVPVPRTSPGVFEIDPRAQPDEHMTAASSSIASPADSAR